MDRALAKTVLQARVAWDSRPALTDAQVEALLDQARRPDAEGLVHTDDGWAGAYDLDWAAAEGWRWKAATVAGDFSFSADGGRFDKAAVHAACLEQAAEWDKKVARRVSVVEVRSEADPAASVLGNA